MSETAKHISKPILGKFLFVYMVFYVYAQFGTLLLGGAITYENFETKAKSPPFYYLMNFNDFGAALITLFQQMVVNNWFVVVQMFVNVKDDDSSGFSTFWIRAFFVSFWIIMVLIQLNIVIAIVLEIYGSVSDEVKEKQEKKQFRMELKNYFKGAD